MSITSRINEMSSHIEQAYDELQGLGADLTNVNKNIENISMVLDDIYDSMPQVSGEGTSLTLDDTRVGKIKSTLKGNTSQTGTPTPATPITVNVVTGDNTIDICGKNLANPSDIYDGYPTGTNGGTIGFNPSANSITYRKCAYVVAGQPYTLSWKINTIKAVGSRDIKIVDNNNIILGNFSYSNANNNRTRTFTPTYSGWVYAALDTNATEVQIEKGVADTTYEPYQGSNYAINLGVENLLDLTSLNPNQVGQQVSNIQENSFIMSGTAVWGNEYFFYENTNKNTTYTASCKYLSSLARKSGLSIYGTNETTGENLTTINSLLVDIPANVETPVTNTFNSGNYDYIVFRYWNNATATALSSRVDLYVKEVQLEKGSKANSYTPYGTTPIELGLIGTYKDKFIRTSGKNLFDKDSISNGFLDESGIVGGDTSAYRTSDFIPILPNTAYYKTTTSSPRTKYYDKNKQPLNTTTYWDIPIGGNAGTFTTPSNAYYFRFSYPVTGVNVNSIMINKGTTAIDYEPYGSGEWYTHKEIGKVVLNGSEDWNADGGTQGTDYRHNILRSRLDIPNPIGINNTYLSNYFIAHTINNDVGVLGEFYCNANWFIFLDKNKVYDLNGWKTWLSTNNPMVYYVLAEATNTKITYEPLLDQLEAFYNAKSKNSQTNITQENNDLPFEISASALEEWSV